MTRKRVASIDFLRCMAAIAVVGIHVVTAPKAVYAGDLGGSIDLVLDKIHTLLMWSIPIFFMITGYCCGQRNECDYHYVFKKIGKYIVVLFTVGLFYSLLEKYFTMRTFSVWMLLSAILDVINGQLWDHMWFVYAIIGIYLVLPLLHSFVKNSKESFVFTFILFLVTIFLPWISTVSPIHVDLMFPITSYIFYVMFGLECSNTSFEKMESHKNIYTVVAVALIVITLLLMVFSDVTANYSNLFVCIQAVGIFYLGVTWISKISTPMLSMLSDCTWGVYLFHPLFINVVLKVLHVDLLSELAGIKLLVFGCGVVVVSFISTWILKKVPFVKKYL